GLGRCFLAKMAFNSFVTYSAQQKVVQCFPFSLKSHIFSPTRNLRTCGFVRSNLLDPGYPLVWGLCGLAARPVGGGGAKLTSAIWHLPPPWPIPHFHPDCSAG